MSDPGLIAEDNALHAPKAATHHAGGHGRMCWLIENKWLSFVYFAGASAAGASAAGAAGACVSAAAGAAASAGAGAAAGALVS